MEENNTQPKQQLSTPVAIVLAGFLIMIGIIITKGAGTGGFSVNSGQSKTLSEQVGVSKDKLNACIVATDVDAVSTRISESVDKAMSHIPKDERGTPYSVVIGPNGFKTEIRGADSYERTNMIIAAAKEGRIATADVSVKQADGTTKIETQNISEVYKGSVAISEPNDHTMGASNPVVTVIEYSDFECPFCKQFHPTMERIIKENGESVRWIYRHYPIHQHSFEKLVAADCIAQLKGNDAFWKYSDLLFGLLKTGDESVSEQL